MFNVMNNWQEVLIPYRIESINSIQNRDSIVIEPLNKGFGITLGTALRRVLLSSISGVAVTSLSIEGALSEFAVLSGVKEDIIDIILNLKSLKFKKFSDLQKRAAISAVGPCVVTAKMIQCDSTLEIINPDHEICSLSEGAVLNMFLTIDTGKGYIPAKKLSIDSNVIGRIAIDANFSPIKNVSFDIEEISASNYDDCEKLIMNVETDGSISAIDAVYSASEILCKQFASIFNINVNFSSNTKSVPINDSIPVNILNNPPMKLLLKKVKDIDFSIRCLNCMQCANIVYVGDLVINHESDLLKTPNFGRKSLNEIKLKLQEIGLSLGMTISNWPPDNIEDLIAKMDENSI